MSLGATGSLRAAGSGRNRAECTLIKLQGLPSLQKWRGPPPARTMGAKRQKCPQSFLPTQPPPGEGLSPTPARSVVGKETSGVL